MSIYKPFTTSDVVVTPFKVNKSFSFQGESAFTASNVGIDRFLGRNIPTTLFSPGVNPTGQISSQNQKLIYDSVKQLYYSNYLRGEDGSSVLTSSLNTDGTISGESSIMGATSQPMYENYLSPTLVESWNKLPSPSSEIISVLLWKRKDPGLIYSPNKFDGIDITPISS